MVLATGLLRCAVTVFMSILLVLSMSLSLRQYRVSGSLHVIPQFKKEHWPLIVNYHTASLLASFSKICEKVVLFCLYNFLMEIGFLYVLQSGFRPGDSTTRVTT